MSSVRDRFRLALLPSAIFLATLVLHFAWLRLFPDRPAAQSQWLVDILPPLTPTEYIANGDHWIGMSYGVMLVFSIVTFHIYRTTRICGAQTMALGGVTVTGLFAVLGCFLIGCCGSPMLAVYIAFFGLSFLSIAKPLIFLATTLSAVGGGLWLCRHARCDVPSRGDGGIEAER